MSYVITDGKRYCHRTKTRAVEIVNDLDSATRFVNKDMAENILQRATKKLSGFHLMEVGAGAEKASAKAKPEKPSEETEGHTIEKSSGKTSEKTEDGRKQSAGKKKKTGKHTVKADMAEEQAEKKEEVGGQAEKKEKVGRQAEKKEEGGRKQSARNDEEGNVSANKSRRRRGRPSKKTITDAVEPTEPVEQVVEPTETATDDKKTTGTALPPSFKMVVHRTSEQKQANANATKAAPVKAEDQQAPNASDEGKKAPAAPEQTTGQTVESASTSETGQTQEVKKTSGRSRGRSRRGRSNAAKSGENAAVTGNTEAAESTAAAETDKASEKAPSAASVIPMFKVQTHHVSENAVAKPIPKKETPSKQGDERSEQPDGETISTEIDYSPSKSSKNSRSRGNGHSESAQEKGSSSSASKGKKANASESESKNTESKSTESKSSETKSRRGSRSRAVSSTEAKRRIFTQQERNEIYNRTEGHCAICGKFIPLGEYTVDHIIPLSKGGTNDLDNLQACCSFCNKAKDDSMGEDFFQRIENIYLYQTQLRYGKKKMKKLKRTMEEIKL